MIHSNVTIHVVTYTALVEAARCLKAVMATRQGAKMILTANGNQAVADYFHWIAANFPDVKVRVNRENQGFIFPTNEAFRECDTEFFAVINDDAVPPPQWLSMMKAKFTDSKMAVVGAKGGCTTLDPNFVGHKGNQLDYIEFSCAMIRCELMTTPLFSPYLKFAYGEDADLCLRVRERGLLIAQADFAIEHNRNTTSRKVPGIRHIMADNFATCRKRWGYYLKHRKFENQCASPS